MATKDSGNRRTKGGTTILDAHEEPNTTAPAVGRLRLWETDPSRTDQQQVKRAGLAELMSLAAGRPEEPSKGRGLTALMDLPDGDGQTDDLHAEATAFVEIDAVAETRVVELDGVGPTRTLEIGLALKPETADSDGDVDGTTLHERATVVLDLDD